MPIKYAEITIIINTEEETILNYFNRLIGNENKTNDNDTIIIRGYCEKDGIRLGFGECVATLLPAK